MNVFRAGKNDTESWIGLASQVSELFGLNLAKDEGFLSSLRRHIQGGNAFCVKRNDDPQGDILGGLLLSKEGNDWEIDWLAVDQNTRGLGVGKILVAHIETLITTPAVLKVWTFAKGDRGYEQAWRFYTSVGMTPSQIIQGDFPHGTNVQEFIKVYE